MESNAESTNVNDHGYKILALGSYSFSRDEYFAHIRWPGGSHLMPVDRFLRALMRDVAWNFFYGVVNFDEVFGTVNHYGTVDVFAGLFNAGYRSQNKQFVENFDGELARTTFGAILEDWTIAGFDPFAAPEETGLPFGPKQGSNQPAVTRKRVVAKRMVGLTGDPQLRNDANGFPV